MSAAALTRLARLAGARRHPPARLYGDRWPSRGLRLLQLAFNVVEWVLSGGRALVLRGPSLVAAAGPVWIDGRLSWTALREGAYVMRGADLDTLAQRVGLSRLPTPTFHLADAGVLVALGERDGQAVAAHATDDEARLRRYRAGMDRARAVMAPHGGAHLVPAVLEWRQLGGDFILVQTRLPGTTVQPGTLTGPELEIHIEAALEPLRWLHRAAVAVPPDAAIVDAQLEQLLGIPAYLPHVQAPLAALRAWRAGLNAAVLAHGDYWLANILFEPGKALPKVTGLLDWERSRSDACTGFDALHLLVFSFAHWRGCSEMAVLSMLWDGRCEPLLERLIQRVSDRLEMPLEHLRYVGLLIWLMHLDRQSPDFESWSATQRRDWLESPAVSAQRWLARSA